MLYIQLLLRKRNDDTGGRRADEVSVENGEGQQRTAEHHDEIQDIGVDHTVHSVAAELQ